MGELVVVSRFRLSGTPAGPGAVDEPGEARLADDLHAAHRALAARPGYVRGHVGRSLDDPDLWLLTTTWADVGSYRRALSSYDVKVAAVPALARALDEPSAYETLDEGGLGNRSVPRRLG